MFLLATTTLPEPNLELNHQQFVRALVKFFRSQNPSPFIPDLIRQMQAADQSEHYSFQIAGMIYRCVCPYAAASRYLKMQIFWLVGEIFSNENEHSLRTLRSKLNVQNLFTNFLKLFNRKVC